MFKLNDFKLKRSDYIDSLRVDEKRLDQQAWGIISKKMGSKIWIPFYGTL